MTFKKSSNLFVSWQKICRLGILIFIPISPANTGILIPPKKAGLTELYSVTYVDSMFYQFLSEFRNNNEVRFLR